MRRILLTLDTSDVTGFAIGDPLRTSGGAPAYSGVLKLPKDVTISRKANVLRGFVLETIVDYSVTDVWIEKPFILNSKSESVVYAMLNLVLAGGMAADERGCYCSLIGQQEWRSALGLPTVGPKNVMADPHYAERFGKRKDGLKAAKRQYVKDRAMEYAKRMGSEPVDDNEGDAICMWHAVGARIRAKIEAPKSNLFDRLDV